MLLDALIQKTEIFIDEASAVTTNTGSLSSIKKPLKAQIEECLTNAFRPLYVDVNPLRVHCLDLTNTITIVDGVGVVSFDDEFIRLKLVKMKSWDRPVIDIAEVGSEEYKKQQNIYSRAGQSRPIVTYNGASDVNTKLYLYTSSSDTDTIENLEVIWNWGVDNVQDDLVDALCWGAARYYFSIISGVNIPEMVIENYKSRLL